MNPSICLAPASCFCWKYINTGKNFTHRILNIVFKVHIFRTEQNYRKCDFLFVQQRAVQSLICVSDGWKVSFTVIIDIINST